MGRRPYSIPPESFSESVAVGALVGAATSAVIELGVGLAQGARGADLGKRVAVAAAFGAALGPLGQIAGLGAQAATRIGATRVAAAITNTLAKTNAVTTATKGFIGGSITSATKLFNAGAGDILGSSVIAGVTSSAAGFVPGVVKNALTKVFGTGLGAKIALDLAAKGGKKGISLLIDAASGTLAEFKEAASSLLEKLFGDGEATGCAN